MNDNVDHGRAPPGAKAQAPHPAMEDEDEDPPFKPLTRQEVQALRARHPPLSPWVVLGVQALAGLALTAGAWVLWRQSNAVWSALYGVAAVVIPGALMARGMSRQSGETTPGGAVIGFMVWELAKVLTAVAMLVAAVKVVPDLHWPALLVTMIVSLKMNWLVLLWHRPTQRPEPEMHHHVR